MFLLIKELLSFRCALLVPLAKLPPLSRQKPPVLCLCISSSVWHCADAGSRCTTWLIKLKEHDVSLIEFSVGEIKSKRRNQNWSGVEWKVRDDFQLCLHKKRKNKYIYVLFSNPSFHQICMNIFIIFICSASELKITWDDLPRTNWWTNSFIQYNSHHKCWVQWGTHFSITKIESRFSVPHSEG